MHYTVNKCRAHRLPPVLLWCAAGFTSERFPAGLPTKGYPHLMLGGFACNSGSSDVNSWHQDLKLSHERSNFSNWTNLTLHQGFHWKAVCVFHAFSLGGGAFRSAVSQVWSRCQEVNLCHYCSMSSCVKVPSNHLYHHYPKFTAYGKSVSS